MKVSELIDQLMTLSNPNADIQLFVAATYRPIVRVELITQDRVVIADQPRMSERKSNG